MAKQQRILNQSLEPSDRSANQTNKSSPDKNIVTALLVIIVLFFLFPLGRYLTRHNRFFGQQNYIPYSASSAPTQAISNQTNSPNIISVKENDNLPIQTTGFIIYFKLIPVKGGRPRETTLDGDIWKADPTGANPQKIYAHHLVANEHPQWDISPDNTTLVTRDDSGNLVSVNISTSKSMSLGLFGQAPQYSPDGKKILYFGHGPSYSSSNGLYVINSDGSNNKRVYPPPSSTTNEPDEYYTPQVWSPDSQRVVFEASQNGFSVIKIANVDTGAVETILDETILKSFNFNYNYLHTPLWGSSTTNQIAFVMERAESVPTLDTKLGLYDVSSKKVIAADYILPHWSRGSSYSPDGKKIALPPLNPSLNDEKSYDLALINEQGKTLNVFNMGSGIGGTCGWSADGRYLLIAGGSLLMIFNPAKQSYRTIVEGVFGTETNCWSK